MKYTGPQTRMTWSFRDQKYGWTESWVANSLLQAVDAKNLLTEYLSVRMPLMGVGIWADYARASWLDGSGTTFHLQPNYISTTGQIPPQNSSGTTIVGFTGYGSADGTPPDRPYSTLMFTFYGSLNQSKVIYLSGIPDDVIIDPFGPTFKAAYANALLAWTRFIFANSWGWIGKKGNNQAPKLPILSVTAGGANGSVTVNNPPFALNSSVQIGGFRNLKGYRGTFFVANTAGNVVTLQGYDPPTSLAKVTGYAQQVVFSFQQATVYASALETKHSRGKGIALPVGRRKARSN